ncbi:hypothetical protein E2C01_000392 [Portunus trituberculatus]|uniref:Uncharacterized protein n=1 Tax=Portunus trituberculatus TaxID=210409 RepID=A0A5B7CET8_PORTR|nr:hypothetical protein [Portunus trituberculatus]
MKSVSTPWCPRASCLHGDGWRLNTAPPREMTVIVRTCLLQHREACDVLAHKSEPTSSLGRAAKGGNIRYYSGIRDRGTGEGAMGGD